MQLMQWPILISKRLLVAVYTIHSIKYPDSLFVPALALLESLDVFEPGMLEYLSCADPAVAEGEHLVD